MKLTKNRGFSLIEVLVTLVIVAIGLLGLLALQMRSFGLQTDSLNRKAAAELSSQLAERLAGNLSGYRAVVPSLTSPVDYLSAPVVPNCTNCTATELWNRDIALWVQEARRRLPGAVARVAPSYANASERVISVNVILGWQEPNAQTEGVNGSCAGLDAPYNADSSYRCITSTLFPG